MLYTRATRLGLQRGSLQFFCKPSATSTPATRFISSNSNSTRLRLVAGTYAPRNIWNLRQDRSSSICRRSFSATTAACHGHIDPPKPGEELYVTFVDKEGDEHKIAVSKGDNLLTIAQAHDIEMEGACEGSCSCSTCHVIVDNEEMFDKIPEATDDENDMLDLAFGLTETSRLGCQIEMTPEIDGLRVKLPSSTRNLQASDFSTKK